MESELNNSTTGKNMEFAQTALIWACRWPLLISSNFEYSIFCRLNNCTIVIPVRCSCTKVFSFVTCNLSNWNEDFIALAKIRVAIIKIGTGIKVIKDNSQFVENISKRTKNKEIKSPEISIKPAEKTSVMASTSDTTRVTRAPTGVLSK